MKTQDLRKKSALELNKLILEKEGEIREFRFKGPGTGERNVRSARAARHVIARAKTVLNEINRNEG